MIRTAVIACILGGAAQAATLEFPSNATRALNDVRSPDSHSVAIGAYGESTVPMREVTGEVTRQAWMIDAPGITTAQIVGPLREQLVADGFNVVFECETDGCGGFDFRFAIDVSPAPAMIVDLGDFRYVSTSKGDEVVSLMVSRTSTRGFVDVTRVGPSGSAVAQSSAPAVRATVARTDAAAVPDDFGAALETDGRLVLSDLAFQVGSSNLGDAAFASLDLLAEYLSANPNKTIALVGHTDSSGSLNGNIALSKRRASSVLDRLTRDYDIPRRQMEAEGMGYLSPLSTNLTQEGRDLNRRVEVIVTSTE
ncbi:MAG: OmpA family protein [Paracoccaceae bacterium]|nr:OmpA family protein [Paracoccaceae bacterium]